MRCEADTLIMHRRALDRWRLPQRAALPILAVLAAACQAPPAWNVLLVTFDTTRADHLGAYGHDGIETPVLDRLAAEGVLFEQALSPVPITLPAHGSIMTGKIPFTHGVRDNGLFVLGQEQETLAEILNRNGYRTAAAIGAFPLIAKFGIDQGFELFDDHLTAEYEDIFGERAFPKDRFFFDERPAARVNEAVLPWLEERRSEPFFLWVHYFDPHHPLEPPAPYDQLYLHDPYAGEIAYADESLGTLLDRLRRLGLYERTVVVFTADHGEGLGEHDESTHSLLVYNSTLHVPLIVHHPDGASGRRVTERVSTVDVLPTVLDLLELPTPDGIQGVSLGAWVRAETPPPVSHRRRIYAETLSPRLSRGWGELRALVAGDYKYIHGPRPELYDLEHDPSELEDLIGERSELAAELQAELEAYLEREAVPGLDASVALDEETARRLRALGYLQTSGGRVGPIAETLRSDGEPPQDHAGTITEYSRAKSLLFSGRLVDAKQILLELLRRDTANPHYLELLADVEMRLGRPEEAISILARLEAAAVDDAGAEHVRRLSARVLLLQGRPSEALVRLEQAETVTATAAGQYRIGKILEANGELASAQARFERSLELDPDFVPAHIDLGIHHAAAGRLETAELHFRRALEGNPYDARAAYNYAAFLVQVDRLEPALDTFRRAVELRADYLQALYAVVELEVRLGLEAEARASLAALDRLAPESPEAALARRLFEAEG